MKRVLITAALSAAIFATGIPVLAQTANTDQGTTATAPAQGQGRHHGMHKGDRMAMMAKKLNLSQQQQDQLKPIFEQSRQQAQTIKNDSTLSQDQKKQKLQALHENTKSQMNGILTPEQQQQMKQMKEHRKADRADRRQHRGEFLAQKLNLSEQQQAQLKPVMQKQREQAKAIWQDNSLTQDQKKQKMQALHQDTQAQLNSILTPEQQKQWQDMQAQRKQFRQHRHGFGEGQQQQPQPQGA